MIRRAFVTGLSACLGAGACRGDSSHALIGQTLPSVRGVDTNGEGFDLAAIAKPAVIRFWGMWCGPCMIDMPNWFSAVTKMRAMTQTLPNLNIFTIHTGRAPANGPSLPQWVAGQSPDVATRVIDDANQAITRAVGIPGTPSTIYVSRAGKIEEHAWQFKNARGEDSFIRKVVYLSQREAR